MNENDILKTKVELLRNAQKNNWELIWTGFDKSGPGTVHFNQNASIDTKNPEWKKWAHEACDRMLNEDKWIRHIKGYGYKVTAEGRKIVEGIEKSSEAINTTATDGSVVTDQRPSTQSDFWQELHPEITKTAQTLFVSGHHAESAEASFKHINKRVKDMYRNQVGKELDGVSLMTTAFSAKDPVFELDNFSTETGKNIQSGYMYLFAGAMSGIRNPHAHENIVIDAVSAKHLLYLASLLCKKLDQTKPYSPSNKVLLQEKTVEQKTSSTKKQNDEPKGIEIKIETRYERQNISPQAEQWLFEFHFIATNGDTIAVKEYEVQAEVPIHLTLKDEISNYELTSKRTNSHKVFEFSAGTAKEKILYQGKPVEIGMVRCLINQYNLPMKEKILATDIVTRIFASGLANKEMKYSLIDMNPFRLIDINPENLEFHKIYLL